MRMLWHARGRARPLARPESDVGIREVGGGGGGGGGGIRARYKGLIALSLSHDITCLNLQKTMKEQQSSVPVWSRLKYREVRRPSTFVSDSEQKLA